MHILIDDQIAVNVTPGTMQDEDGNDVVVLEFTDTADLLDTWAKLSPGRRGYRYGRDDGDTEPSTIFVAEATRHGLNLDDIAPHWDGRFEHNAYRLDALKLVLPIKWGAEIGEEVKTNG